MDKFVGVVIGVINEIIYLEKELCCFLFIVIGLYLIVVFLVLS